ncbi:hypothetical protein ACUSIJ_26365 [Pseudochelatococcus sp. B33]
MVEIEHLVVEALEPPFGDDQQTHRNIEARQPGGGLGQMTQMIDVRHDVFALANAPHGRDQTNAIVRLDHGVVPFLTVEKAEAGSGVREAISGYSVRQGSTIVPSRQEPAACSRLPARRSAPFWLPRPFFCYGARFVHPWKTG